MRTLSYTYSRGQSGPINEPCPFGVHYTDTGNLFHVGSAACTNLCPHFRKEGSSRTLRRVCCTADEKEFPRTEIQP